MKGKRHVAAVMALIFIAATAGWAAEEAEKDYTRQLRDLKLYVPDDPDARSYLGIGEKDGQFPLEGIRTDVLIIEIFSMYCPHCQKHAPVANELYRAIERDKDLNGRIRMIGIGVGNSPYEVRIFKEKYSPPFPLFDDRDSAFVNAFAGILTPHYFGLKMNGDDDFEVFYSKDGGYTDAGAFLDTIVRLSGLKRGTGQ